MTGKSIRIPLPTNEGTLLEGKRRIGVKPGMAFDSKLKVPCIGYLNNHRLTAAELQVPVLNQLEEELRNMTQKSRIGPGRYVYAYRLRLSIGSPFG